METEQHVIRISSVVMGDVMNVAKIAIVEIVRHVIIIHANPVNAGIRAMK
jgi:hypothetical protein